MGPHYVELRNSSQNHLPRFMEISILRMIWKIQFKYDMICCCQIPWYHSNSSRSCYDMGSSFTPFFHSKLDHFNIETTTLAHDTSRIEPAIMGVFTSHVMVIEWAYLMGKTRQGGYFRLTYVPLAIPHLRLGFLDIYTILQLPSSNQT